LPQFKEESHLAQPTLDLSTGATHETAQSNLCSLIQTPKRAEHDRLSETPKGIERDSFPETPKNVEQDIFQETQQRFEQDIFPEAFKDAFKPNFGQESFGVDFTRNQQQGPIENLETGTFENPAQNP